MLRWLSELTDKDHADVGPKIARLGSLRANGIEVPDGFAITTAAFERFLAGNDLAHQRRAASWTCAISTTSAELEAASLRMRELIEQAPMEGASKARCATPMTNFASVMATSACRSQCAVPRRAKMPRPQASPANMKAISASSAPTRLLAAVRQAWSSLFVAAR